ncbi:hypothetical protein P168DRAFT_237884 [Aspergillus campestris IBT 28561]|uniref:Uncharacterized protein n=1 Tax=Aspergillus campestris (strain IBT 28561) TaxID=1392248 RepID=A0A2I1D1F0_ASPC2|nr:uncharacterized protein P168DRAFT_237884 [Aspergillus campestris IBT 28561]PKY03687.1 hypothetical protein P168DRAFT_237884 [Aspergillus campestris IBT 28561]
MEPPKRKRPEKPDGQTPASLEPGFEESGQAGQEQREPPTKVSKGSAAGGSEGAAKENVTQEGKQSSNWPHKVPVDVEEELGDEEDEVDEGGEGKTDEGEAYGEPGEDYNVGDVEGEEEEEEGDNADEVELLDEEQAGNNEADDKDLENQLERELGRDTEDDMRDDTNEDTPLGDEQDQPDETTTNGPKVQRTVEQFGRTPLHGTCVAEKPLTATPDTLLAMLLDAMLKSRPISHDLSQQAVKKVLDEGYHNIQTLGNSSWEDRTGVLRDGGYNRYREQGATNLGEAAQFIREKYNGDLNNLLESAHHDRGEVRNRVKELKGLGDMGVDLFFNNVQSVWPEIAPFLDQRSLQTAEQVGIGRDLNSIFEELEGDALQMSRLANGLSTARRIVNIAVGVIMVLGGIAQFFPPSMGSIIVGAYVIVFGLLVGGLEFLPTVPDYVYRYASFLFSFLGRGAFYIFVGSIMLHGHVLRYIAGSLVGFVGVGYLALEFVPSIEPPSNMRESDQGWGAEQV